MQIPVLMMARELGFGGMEAELSKFARHLPAHGIAPHIACFRPGGSRWREVESAGLPLLHIPVTSLKSRSAVAGARLLRRYLQEHKIQVLHSFDNSTAVLSVPVARLAGVPVTMASQLCFRGFEQMRIRALLPALDRIATGLHVNCHAIADHLVRDWKVPRQRVHVCYTGVETREFHPNNRARPGALAGASVVIGTLAVLREEKNLPLLVDAFAEVQRNVDSRARLLVAGDGPLKQALERQARDLGIAGACLFPGAVTRSAEWMRAIDVFVLPSRSEGLSSALLEAMACGCCPVGSRVGGTPEVIRHGERGLLFEPGNREELAGALSLLTTGQHRRQAMAEAAAHFASTRLNVETAAATLASIYRSLLETRRKSHDSAHDRPSVPAA